MSPNIQESVRKRSHGDFLDNGISVVNGMPLVTDEGSPAKRMANSIANPFRPLTTENLPPLRPCIPPPSPPGQDSLASLVTDGGSSEPAKNSPSPTKTPSKDPLYPNMTAVNMPQPPVELASASQSVIHNPPVKRKRLTAEEKAAKLEAELAKKKEREEAKAARDAEKHKAFQEKMARAETLARQKEEKERKEKEEKERKYKSQLRLNSFFVKGPVTPKKATDVAAAQPGSASPFSPTPQAKAEPEKISDYDKLFKPFFVKDNVRVATKSSAVDVESRQARSRVLDEFVEGHRPEFDVSRFDAVATLHLPGRVQRRGQDYRSVKQIMASAGSAPVDPTTESQAREQLKAIQMKYLFYREDVRPAYWGTITSQPLTHLRKAAKRPTSRCLPAVNYDYDSEAEWVDDEGEDILDDADDDEEDVDDEDMAEFLDDSEAIAPARAAFLGVMEPDSTGVCFETETRWTSSEKLRHFKLEIILESLDIHASIDPFTSSYWEPEPKSVKASKNQTLVSAAEQAPAAGTLPVAASLKPWIQGGMGNPHMPPPSLSGDTSASASGAPTASTGPLPAGSATAASTTGAVTMAHPTDPKKMVRAELLEEFKRKLLQFSHLSKVGLVELISAEMPDVTRNQVKYTIEAIAINDGVGGRKTKNDWKLREGWSLVSGQ